MWCHTPGEMEAGDGEFAANQDFRARPYLKTNRKIGQARVHGWRCLWRNFSTWVWALGPTWWKEKNFSSKLSFDPHVHAAGMHTVNNKCMQKTISKSKQKYWNYSRLSQIKVIILTSDVLKATRILCYYWSFLSGKHIQPTSPRS